MKNFILVLLGLFAAFYIGSTYAEGYCLLCTDFGTFAEIYIKEKGLNTTDIINEFETLTCNELPVPFSTICDEFVEAYGIPLISCLVAGNNTTICCQTVGLCPVSSHFKGKPIQTIIPSKLLKARLN